MVLRQMQRLLGGIYDVDVTHDVYDYLVTDRMRLPACARETTTDEQLVVEQGGEDVGVSLYLDRELLERLAAANPLETLHGGNLADYWTALEGVSHFLYLAWNAGHDKPVSLLELELQAEVDKYVSSLWLLRAQAPERFPTELHAALFLRARVDPVLAGDRVQLYREANDYAARFCRYLDGMVKHGAREGDERMIAELRRFYRLTQRRKRELIERRA
jgi:hypothetical protein